MKKVVVAGSINMDLVTVCERAPKGGGNSLERIFQVPGGKELIRLLQLVN